MSSGRSALSSSRGNLLPPPQARSPTPPQSDSHPFIYAYADQLSVAPDDELGFCVSTDLAAYSMEIARVGAERRLVWSRQGIPGSERAVPDDASTHGCRWPVSLAVRIAPDWPSGYYSAVLRGYDAAGSTARGEVGFVVRSAHPGRDTRILFQRPTNTENAYNSWGGYTFYCGPDGPARRLSFDRPFAGFPGCEPYLFTLGDEAASELDRGCASEPLLRAFAGNGFALTPHHCLDVERPGERWHILDVGFLATIKRKGASLAVYSGFSTWLSCWHHWERRFVAWAEHAGYEIDYATNGDLEFRPELLSEYRLVLSVGHDEYWSAPMRDHLETFIGGGGNVAFLSGNVSWWQVRSEDRGRTTICWKDEFENDPHFARGEHATLTTLWCHHLIGRPETQLTGVSFAYGGYCGLFGGPPTTGGYTVHRPDHWLFSGTGLCAGDRLGDKDRIVYYECDGCDLELADGLPMPTHRDGSPDSFEILATSPAALSEADDSISMASEAIHGPSPARRRDSGAAVLGTYTRGGTVVTSGCTDWCMGLEGRDPHVERITHNILQRLS